MKSSMKTLKMYKGLSITFKLIIKVSKNYELYFVTQEDNNNSNGKHCLVMTSDYNKASKIFKEWIISVL